MDLILLHVNQPPGPPIPLSCNTGEILVTSTGPDSAECQSTTTSSTPPTVCEEGDLINGQCVVEEPTPPPPPPTPEPEPEPEPEPSTRYRNGNRTNDRNRN